MDNVKQLQNYTDLTLRSGTLSHPHQMIVYPDPLFDKFADGVKQMYLPKSDYLTINVSRCIVLVSGAGRDSFKTQNCARQDALPLMWTFKYFIFYF